VKARQNVVKAKATKQKVVVPKTPLMSLSLLIISENKEGDKECLQHKRSKKALIKSTLKRKVKDEKITTVISHITAGEREQYPRLAKLTNWQDMAVVMGGYSLSVKKALQSEYAQ